MLILTVLIMASFMEKTRRDRQGDTELGAIYLRLEELKSEPIISAVQGTLGYREEWG